MTQRAYKDNLDSVDAGCLVAVDGSERVRTYTASAIVTPGDIVSFSSATEVTPVGTASINYAGVAIADHLAGSGDDDTYAVGDNVPVYNRCTAKVLLTGGTASKMGGTVYRVLATGAVSASAGTNNPIIANARFESVANSGETVDVYFG